MCELQAMHK